MAIDVCPGPIRPIRQISAYFPRLSPTSSFSEPLSPNQAAAPAALSPGSGGQGGGAAGGGGSGLLSPLLPGAAGGGGSLSAMSSMDTSIEIDSCDSDDNSESPGSNDFVSLKLHPSNFPFQVLIAFNFLNNGSLTLHRRKRKQGSHIQ